MERGTTCSGEAITIFSLFFPTTRLLRSKRRDCTPHVVLSPKRGEWGDYGLFNLEDRVILYEICILGCCYCEEFGVREITAEQLYDHAVKSGQKLTDDARKIIDLVQEFTIEF